MTQEKEQLLLKDISARFQYRVYIRKKVCHKFVTEELQSINRGQIDDEVYINGYKIAKSRPYLRPLSSITNEEFVEYHDMLVSISKTGLMQQNLITKVIDWLDKKMFDHRNLIEKGLALEAPEDMYKF